MVIFPGADNSTPSRYLHKKNRLTRYHMSAHIPVFNQMLGIMVEVVGSDAPKTMQLIIIKKPMIKFSEYRQISSTVRWFC